MYVYIHIHIFGSGNRMRNFKEKYKYGVHPSQAYHGSIDQTNRFSSKGDSFCIILINLQSSSIDSAIIKDFITKTFDS